MNLENLKMLEQAIEHLEPFMEEVVFVGGATVELWITDEAAPEFRPTTDIAVIVEVTTRAQYYRFEERIRSAGFENDHASRVICRFKHPESKLVIDVMPTEASILGFENAWQKKSLPARRACSPAEWQGGSGNPAGFSSGDEAGGFCHPRERRFPGEP